MNGNSAPSQKPTSVQIIAVLSASLIALTLAFAIMWCAIWKIYIEPTMLMLIGTVLGGIGGALTTILVGRSLAQLNHPESDDAPQPVLVKNDPAKPAETIPVAPIEPEPKPTP